MSMKTFHEAEDVACTCCMYLEKCISTGIEQKLHVSTPYGLFLLNL